MSNASTKSPENSGLLDFDFLVQKQVNKILQKGSLASSLLGFSSSVLLIISMKLGIEKDIIGPVLWAFIGGLYSFVIYLLAKNDKIKGSSIALVMLGFCCLPSVIYIYAYYSLPAGTAMYLSGPPSNLYFFLIIVTGWVVGALGTHVRQLIAETLNQEKEKSLINRIFGMYVSCS